MANYIYFTEEQICELQKIHMYLRYQILQLLIHKNLEKNFISH